MFEGKDLCDAVIAHYHNGKNAPEMSTALANKVHRLTVHRGFNLNDSVNGRQSSERRHTG